MLDEKKEHKQNICFSKFHSNSGRWLYFRFEADDKMFENIRIKSTWIKWKILNVAAISKCYPKKPFEINQKKN